MRRATKLYIAPHEVGAKLAEFGVTLDECLHIVAKVVGARHEAIPDDPLGAAGQFAYIFGTRNVRALWKSRGWLNHREENVEAVQDPETGRIIVYQSVDIAGVVAHSPKAPRGKGNGARRLIEGATDLLFDPAELPESGPAFAGEPLHNWYYCVSFDTNDDGEIEVGAELSLPWPFQGDNFAGFADRIIIRPHGPWNGVALSDEGPAEDAAEFEPLISRKQ